MSFSIYKTPRILVALLLLSSGSARAIDVSGIKIGMSEEDVTKAVGPLKEFTINGVNGYFPDKPLKTEYRDGGLDQLTFYFLPGRFEKMREAMKEKYPDLACKDTEVPWKEKVLTQTVCSFQDQEAVLRMIRYLPDIRTSALRLFSIRAEEELAKKIELDKQQKSDSERSNANSSPDAAPDAAPAADPGKPQ